ncbi:DNA primase [Desulfogranum mediterraneum]|uniref:DNA primase n=1 Tax=Desulfogranum mediterraneum TaxID=160661 RepID=UPI00041D2E34|nr:DNA primase [Desulfogranum mediterraneum]
MIDNTSRETIKNSVREAADIVEVIGDYVTLKKAGSRYVGLCPFHGEKTPSFSVNPQRQFFYCFGCGASGDAFSFMMQYHHLSFPEALKSLADKYQIVIPEREMSPQERQQFREREQLYSANEAAADLYAGILAREGGAEEAQTYLRGRGVSAEFIQRYRLGYAPAPEEGGWSFATDRLLKQSLPIQALVRSGLAVEKERGGHYDRFRSRIMFPIYDLTGRVVAFGGRILGEGKPKYMNSPESPIFEKSRLLFGLYQHKEAIRKARTALVVEGNFDLLSLAIHGIDTAVAPLGTSLTRHHVHSLRGYCQEVVLLFDADAAGLEAAMRSVPFFLAEQLDCRVALLPQGHDPDSLVRSEGAGAIRERVAAAQPLAEFVFTTLVERHGLTLGGKNKIIGELKPLIEEASDGGQRSLMLAHFSEQLGVAPAQFAVPSQLRQQPLAAAPVGSLERLPRQERQLVEFLILYPEHLEELRAAGMEEVLQEPAALRMVHLLLELNARGEQGPEQIMEVLPDQAERHYVARLLALQGSEGLADEGALAEGQRRELLLWLERASIQQQSLRLQEEIEEAGRQGDTARLMELLQQKMIAGKKRTGC